MSRGFKQIATSYFVTAYVLFGAFLLYAVFALPLRDFDVFPLLFSFAATPMLALLGGVFGGAAMLADRNFIGSSLWLALSAVTYFIWRGVWRSMYGTKRSRAAQRP